MNMGLLHHFIAVLCAGMTALGTDAVFSQPYPTKPIRLVVSSAPVGSNDIFARLVGAKLTEALGQQVIVDSRPGASGITAVQIAAKAPPDGYTLLLGNFSTLAVNLSLFSKIPYDPVKDFQPITLVANVPQMLVVHPSLPVKSLRDLIAMAKANPGKLNYGSGLPGSGAHLASELFNWLAKVDIVMVPYKSGVAGALRELVGGQISMVFAGIPAAVPYLETGRLRGLGVTGKKRERLFPDVPTIAEGGVPGYEVTLWYGVLAPRGVPRSILDTLHQAIVRGLQMPDVDRRFAELGAEVAPGSPNEFSALIRSEIDKWAKVIHAAGVKPQ